jgi:TPP-dependent pyruvate/acetoin dehydrogenase alpha subunit
MTTLEHQYGQMFTIRRFEETLLEMFSQGKLVGTTHTYIGQEADAVGVIGHLDPERDVVFSNHRCHGHYIAFTGDLYGLLCEVMGKPDGTCGGKGGSQHLCNGNFYSNGVQGSIVPVSTGIALAEKQKGSGAVTTVFLGDGTLGQGAVYECLNMASLWRLPMLFVLDTTDVSEIDAAAGRAVDRVRSSGEPFFLVLHTYRFSPHSKGDDFRDPAEIESRRAHDPLAVAGARLDDERRRELEDACERRLAEVVEAAERAPAATTELV